MPGKIIEKNGEKYIVSDDIDPENLDTDKLVEKDDFLKVAEEIQKAHKKIAKKIEDKSEPNQPYIEKLPSIFSFLLGEEKVLFLGFLYSMHFCKNIATYKIKFNKMEAIEIMFLLQGQKAFSLSNISVPQADKKKNILHLNETTGQIHSFVIQDFIDDSGNCELIFGIKE